jgi:hypothetical protein
MNEQIADLGLRLSYIMVSRSSKISGQASLLFWA